MSCNGLNRIGDPGIDTSDIDPLMEELPSDAVSECSIEVGKWCHEVLL